MVSYLYVPFTSCLISISVILFQYNIDYRTSPSQWRTRGGSGSYDFRSSETDLNIAPSDGLYRTLSMTSKPFMMDKTTGWWWNGLIYHLKMYVYIVAWCSWHILYKHPVSLQMARNLAWHWILPVIHQSWRGYWHLWSSRLIHKCQYPPRLRWITILFTYNIKKNIITPNKGISVV